MTRLTVISSVLSGMVRAASDEYEALESGCSRGRSAVLQKTTSEGSGLYGLRSLQAGEDGAMLRLMVTNTRVVLVQRLKLTLA